MSGSRRSTRSRATCARASMPARISHAWFHCPTTTSRLRSSASAKADGHLRAPRRSETRTGGRCRPHVHGARCFRPRPPERRLRGRPSAPAARCRRAVSCHRRMGKPRVLPGLAGQPGPRSAVGRARAAPRRTCGSRRALRGGALKTFRVAMDIGGTFTDFVVVDEAAGSTYSGKVLTTPANPAEGVLAGLEQFIPELRGIEFLVHGTTVGLNSFLEGKGTRVPL